MMILITGGSKNGKSRFAESLFDGFSGRKYYLATMQPFGEDARNAIARHRKMRADKGFLTVEQYTDIAKAEIAPESGVLLECILNLLANEMFSGENVKDCTEKIITEIQYLQRKSTLLAVVTGQVGSDGITYAPETAAYIKALGAVNRALAANADQVVECVYGIPVRLKG